MVHKTGNHVEAILPLILLFLRSLQMTPSSEGVAPERNGTPHIPNDSSAAAALNGFVSCATNQCVVTYQSAVVVEWPPFVPRL